MKTPLKDLANKFVSCNTDQALEIEIPEELKKLDKPLYALRDSLIQTLLFMISKTPNYKDLSEGDLTLVVKIKAVETILNVHELFAQQLASREIFRISVKEFAIIKEAYLHIDQLYQDKSDLEKAANLCKVPLLINFRALINPAFVFNLDGSITSNLYLFISDLLLGSNNSVNTIILNEYMLGDRARVSEALEYLKNFTTEKQFDHSITIPQFIMGIKIICAELQLKPSIVPQTIVYIDGDECRDIDEATLENFVITKLNLLFSKRHFTLPNTEHSTTFLERCLSNTSNICSNVRDTTIQNLFNIQALSVLNRVQGVAK